LHTKSDIHRAPRTATSNPCEFASIEVGDILLAAVNLSCGPNKRMTFALTVICLSFSEQDFQSRR
jgi:hypothetical protein